MTHVLKNGTSATDKRLDRLVQFDERSRDYPIRELLKEVAVPRTYTWACPITLDQGSEGACVGFGMAHELAAAPVEVKNISNQYAHDQIYWPAQRIDEWPGGSYPGATPVYEGTSVLAGAKVVVKELQAAGGYRWGFSLHDLIMGVGYHGPAVLGIDWYQDMFAPDEHGFISVSGDLAGGHCILCRGVNVKGQFFVLRNSWGSNWGLGGDCYVTFEDMTKLLALNGETLFFVHRHDIVI